MRFTMEVRDGRALMAKNAKKSEDVSETSLTVKAFRRTVGAAVAALIVSTAFLMPENTNEIEDVDNENIKAPEGAQQYIDNVVAKLHTLETKSEILPPEDLLHELQLIANEIEIGISSFVTNSHYTDPRYFTAHAMIAGVNTRISDIAKDLKGKYPEFDTTNEDIKLDETLKTLKLIKDDKNLSEVSDLIATAITELEKAQKAYEESERLSQEQLDTSSDFLTKDAIEWQKIGIELEKAARDSLSTAAHTSPHAMNSLGGILSAMYRDISESSSFDAMIEFKTAAIGPHQMLRQRAAQNSHIESISALGIFKMRAKRILLMSEPTLEYNDHAIQTNEFTGSLEELCQMTQAADEARAALDSEDFTTAQKKLNEALSFHAQATKKDPENEIIAKQNIGLEHLQNEIDKKKSNSELVSTASL